MKNGSSAISAIGTPIRLPILLASQGRGVGAGGVSAGPCSRTEAASRRWISSGGRPANAAASRCSRSRNAACNAASSRICRTVRPTQFTYCAAGVSECALHPGKQIADAIEPLAMLEDLRQSGASVRDELRQHGLGRAIAVAEKHQPHRRIFECDAVLRQIPQRLVMQDHEARHVQPIEAPEWHQRIVAIDHAGRRIHRRQQRAQRGLLPGSDRRRDHEVGLRRHAAWDADQNCSEKSISRVLSQ